MLLNIAVLIILRRWRQRRQWWWWWQWYYNNSDYIDEASTYDALTGILFMIFKNIVWWSWVSCLTCHCATGSHLNTKVKQCRAWLALVRVTIRLLSCGTSRAIQAVHPLGVDKLVAKVKCGSGKSKSKLFWINGISYLCCCLPSAQTSEPDPLHFRVLEWLTL